MKTFSVYVEKKEEFAIEAKNLNLEIKDVLNINKIKKIRILNKYEITGVDEETFKKSVTSIFSEPLIDCYFLNPPKEKNMFGVKFLKGQYNKRADFSEQCLKLISPLSNPIVLTTKIFIFEGDLEKKELEKIKSYIINPIECEEANLKEDENFKNPSNKTIKIEFLKDFNNLKKEELEEFIEKNNISMSIEDIFLAQDYFKNEEKRPPTITEIKILDAYWSDHCRHTTFLTEIEDVEIKDKIIFNSFKEYLKIKEELNLKTKPITLMELATLAAKKLKKEGILKNLDETEEINACSIKIPIKINNKEEDVLLMFKNETHNHPTEIEPFGGASTCLGGAIRDPLSGRCYVYQAMRITGASNPQTPIEETLEGKLPQIKIVKGAALGYSSYGNQIGIATGFVEEIYHKGYLAKRMEVGAVIGAVLKKDVTRKTPENKDVVLLIGGKTGRDGCGGASGSSKSHNENSLKSCGAEVQKGNPVEERKIQRLFLNPKVTKLIKKCNDFGAGGVCVAIGELANGIKINLNKVPVKYDGLSPTEISISESQERMAVVVSSKDADFLIKEAEKENVTATKVAEITNENRIVMLYNEEKVVNLSRKFLNSNGAKRKSNVIVKEQKIKPIFFEKNLKTSWIKHLKNLNICSQKGLMKMFDSTIGANTVLMPYGGKKQNTKIQSMVATIPVKGNKETVSLMSYGCNPFLLEQSPYYGAIYAVIESLAKIIATGGNLKNCWLSFQEYFPSIKKDAKRLGLPFSALLGALNAQLNLKVAAIGGKDSMSGSFKNLDEPPTLISFAVSVANIKNIISPEFKKINSKVALIKVNIFSEEGVNYEKILENFSLVENLIVSKKAISVYAIGFGGIVEAVSKMCFGNKIGFKFSESLDDESLFNPGYGGFLIELEENAEEENLKIIGKTTKEYEIKERDFKINLEDLEKAFEETLEKTFPTKCEEKEDELLKKINFNNKESSLKKSILIKTPSPKVLIPVFPGTNCELDLKNQFEKNGAKCKLFIVNNLNESKIKDSISNFAKEIETSNIIAIPGGFSASDEPDGSAKFITAFFKNPKILESLNIFLKEKDGLMLGICNGFQALIKLGLIEHGEINFKKPISATLTYNNIGIHQSLIVKTKILNNSSPWLQYEKIGETCEIAISHGEGKLISTKECLKTLILNNQIASVYVNDENNPTMLSPHNPNGSFFAIEGLTSKDGRIFGRMGHSERMLKNLYKNIPNIKFQQIFKAGVDYFK